MFKLIKKQSRTEQIVDEIKRAVLAGKIEIGDKLPPERELAAQFGVSRTSIREAVKILSTYGILKSVQGGGIYVTDQFSENVLDFLGHGTCLTPVNYKLIYQARIIMETGSLITSLEYITDQDISRLQEIIHATVSENDNERLGLLDAKFHIILIEAANNPILTSFYQMIYKILTNGARMGISLYPDAKKMVMKGHRDIVAAIKSRSKTRCYKAVSTHLTASMKLFEDYFSEQKSSGK